MYLPIKALVKLTAASLVKSMVVFETVSKLARGFSIPNFSMATNKASMCPGLLTAAIKPIPLAVA